MTRDLQLKANVGLDDHPWVKDFLEKSRVNKMTFFVVSLEVRRDGVAALAFFEMDITLVGILPIDKSP